MGAWPLPTGDSLVVPSRAQVYLIGPCDRSFQTTPLRLTMSSGREAHRRRDTEAGGCASPWHGSLQPPEGPPELQIRLPDVELKSTGGVLVKDFKYEVARSSVEPTSNGEACCRRCVPAVSFHLLPHSPYRPVLERERNTQVDRCLGRIARAASSWVTQAARCFGCRTESSRSTTTEPSQTTSLRLLRSRRLVVSQVAMLAHRHLPLACTLSSQA